MLGPHAKKTLIIDYHKLNQYKRLSELFGKEYKAIIIFRDIHSPDNVPIGHWTTLLDHGDSYEYFDSYGLSAYDDYKITNEDKPLLIDLLKTANKRIVESGRKLQSRKEDVNTCGRWCVARVHMRRYNLKKFYDLVDTVHNIPDVAVTLMTMFL